MTNLQQLCKDEEGQGLAEYSLLVGMMVVLVIGTMNLYTGPLGGLYATIQLTFGPLTDTLAF